MTGPRRRRQLATLGLLATNKGEAVSHKSMPSICRSMARAAHNFPGPLLSCTDVAQDRFWRIHSSPNSASTARISTASAHPAGRQTTLTQK
jgi:hypothetical protein